jgi:hypothetical protein
MSGRNADSAGIFRSSAMLTFQVVILTAIREFNPPSSQALTLADSPAIRLLPIKDDYR